MGVRNQVVNCRLRLKRFHNRKHSGCDVLKDTRKEATEEAFRGLKTRNNVRMMHFKVKMRII